MAGTASTGIANAVAIWSPVDAVSAAAASPPSNPALRSTTVNGVAEPGTMRPSAFPANWEHATGNLPSLAERTWVLLTEAPDGGWRLAGHANTNAELVAAARAQIAELQARTPDG
jgi:hypothetical protein